MNYNENEVMKDIIVKAFNLDEYIEIMNEYDKIPEERAGEFQTKFNYFYKMVRRSDAWYKTFYRLLDENHSKTGIELYQDILEKLSNITTHIEKSFASKLLATIDANMPILDQYVIKNLNMEELLKDFDMAPKDKKMEKAVDLYREIMIREQELLERKDVQDAIAKIGTYLSCDSKYDRLTDIKILDFILWSKRSESEDKANEND